METLHVPQTDPDISVTGAPLGGTVSVRRCTQGGAGLHLGICSFGGIDYIGKSRKVRLLGEVAKIAGSPSELSATFSMSMVDWKMPKPCVHW